MRVVLVDDEHLALVRLGKLLGELGGCKLVGSFMNVEEAIEKVTELQPDVVFLDIHMPEIDGLQAAEQIRAIAPETEIVFVTAHNEYALKAFGLEALDYVMKPVSRERLGQTVERLVRRISFKPEKAVKELPMISCMGMLQIRKTNGLPERLKWRTAKIKELFAYLLHHRNRTVSKDTLLELLWPELDEQKGSANLHTSIHRVRNLLKEEIGEGHILIDYSHYGYILETVRLKIDVCEWEDQLRQLQPATIENVSEHQRVLDLYEGAYFEDDNYAWAEVERQRLKSLWMKHADQLGKLYLTHGMDMEALAVYHRIQRSEPLLEDNCLTLMGIYARLKDAGSVEMQYQYLVKMLQQEAGVHPGREIMEWYIQWKQNEIAAAQ